ncbi:hypothetical protein HYR99_18235 [Candidatus Poribacteria bacterium]|nr:hypothetical protein [Candidatus Poribacteria bacterium]
MSRPFNQPVVDLTKIRVTTLRGFVYRFTLVIPIMLEGKQVFSEGDRILLRNLLTEDFGGCTYTNDINHPLFEGTYQMDNEVVVNQNAIYMVYALQNEDSIDYFRTLQRNLEIHAGEEKILVEMMALTLL